MSEKSIKTVEEYQSKLGEIAPKIVFRELCKLEFEKISETKDKKSHDYEIKEAGGNVIAVCEVKSSVNPIRSEDAGIEISEEKMDEISKKRDMNYRSKLRKHHSTAMSQLEGITELPTLVVFSSFDMTDYIDMGMVLQEHKELYPDAPMADAYLLMKIYQSIIPSNIFQIKDTIKIMYNTERGQKFTSQYLSSLLALKNAGVLPINFKVEDSLKV